MSGLSVTDKGKVSARSFFRLIAALAFVLFGFQVFYGFQQQEFYYDEKLNELQNQISLE